MTKKMLLDVAFDILGLTPGAATLSDVKSRFRQLALQHHPDKNIGNEAKARTTFIKVEEAFRALEAHFADPIANPLPKPKPPPAWVPCPGSKAPAAPSAGRRARSQWNNVHRFSARGGSSSTKDTPAGPPPPRKPDVNSRLCKYCEYQIRHGADAVHPQKVSFTMNTPTSSLRQRYINLPSSNLPPRPWTASTLLQEDASLATHAELAASVFSRLMKRALTAEGLDGACWNGWPQFDRPDHICGTVPPKAACPQRIDDFPRDRVSATANFCVLVWRDIQWREDHDLHADQSFASDEEYQDASIELRAKQKLRWRHIIGMLMPLTENSYNLAAPKSRDDAITLLATTTLGHCLQPPKPRRTVWGRAVH